MKKSITSGFSITIAILVASCANNTNQKSQVSQDTTSIDMTKITIVTPLIANADATITTQIQNIYSDYLQLQSALASDKFNDASVAANHLIALMDNFKDSTLPENQKQLYETHWTAIKENATKIANGKGIEQQRIAFEPLSGHVFELLKSFGSNRPVYQTYCPMAFDNKGANWLSDKTAIRNPYFGDKMLECGEVVSMIKK